MLLLFADQRPELMKRVRAWMENDDGKPFYMLNLMRYYLELRPLPNAPEIKGTPRESNARYEAATRSMLLKLGGYPLYAGTPHGKNLVEYDPALDGWSRLLLVRYPSRRALLKLLTQGHQNKTAAAELGISIHTVSFHLRSIYEKLHVHSRSEAVARALREGWIR